MSNLSPKHSIYTHNTQNSQPRTITCIINPNVHWPMVTPANSNTSPRAMSAQAQTFKEDTTLPSREIQTQNTPEFIQNLQNILTGPEIVPKSLQLATFWQAHKNDITHPDYPSAPAIFLNAILQVSSRKFIHETPFDFLPLIHELIEHLTKPNALTHHTPSSLSELLMLMLQFNIEPRPRDLLLNKITKKMLSLAHPKPLSLPNTTLLLSTIINAELFSEDTHSFVLQTIKQYIQYPIDRTPQNIEQFIHFLKLCCMHFVFNYAKIKDYNPLYHIYSTLPLALGENLHDTLNETKILPSLINIANALSFLLPATEKLIRPTPRYLASIRPLPEYGSFDNFNRIAKRAAIQILNTTSLITLSMFIDAQTGLRHDLLITHVKTKKIELSIRLLTNEDFLKPDDINSPLRPDTRLELLLLKHRSKFPTKALDTRYLSTQEKLVTALQQHLRISIIDNRPVCPPPACPKKEAGYPDLKAPTLHLQRQAHDSTLDEIEKEHKLTCNQLDKNKMKVVANL